MSAPRYDVAIVGGGLIGAACADALAGEGLSVCVIESGPLAREASWAGAGILHPIHPWNYPPPLQELLRLAPAEHARLAADLRARLGVDPEYDRFGLLVMDDLERLEAWCDGFAPSRRVSARSEEPAIRADGPALFLPEAGSVKSHLLTRALFEGAKRRGTDIFCHRKALSLQKGVVETSSGDINADYTVVCAGAWASQLCPGIEVEPVRGQILLYKGVFRRMVVFPDGEYVVPRRDGLVLFGSTLENAGYDCRPTPMACLKLMGRARELAGLQPGDQVAAWAGLRPGTRSLLPLLGKDPQRADLVFSCGHFRNGILLAPLSARLVVNLVLGRDSGIDLAPFSPR